MRSSCGAMTAVNGHPGTPDHVGRTFGRSNHPDRRGCVRSRGEIGDHPGVVDRDTFWYGGALRDDWRHLLSERSAQPHAGAGVGSGRDSCQTIGRQRHATKCREISCQRRGLSTPKVDDHRLRVRSVRGVPHRKYMRAIQPGQSIQSTGSAITSGAPRRSPRRARLSLAFRENRVARPSSRSPRSPIRPATSRDRPRSTRLATLFVRTRSFDASASAIITSDSSPFDTRECRTNAMCRPSGDQPTPENTCVASFRGVPPRNGTRHKSGEGSRKAFVTTKST